MKVIDNFLPSYEFSIIQKVLLEDPAFPWYYTDCINRVGDGYFQFVHSFYEINSYYEKIVSPDNYGKMFSGVERLLDYPKWRRIKGNVNPKTFFKRFTGWHSDFPTLPSAKTAILYVNTNNGGTRFKKGGMVKCVENRLVIFDSLIPHAGITCTDQKRKVVVNFNYE